MVREGRYPGLDLPTAAMALYTMQTQAPSGGRGNLTSLRGGGPMTVLVDPGGGLWPLVWSNVPDGTPARPEDLPWMRRTVTSEGGVAHFPHQGHPATVFFGMPQRLWLVAEEDRVTGMIQRPNGTRYRRRGTIRFPRGLAPASSAIGTGWASRCAAWTRCADQSCGRGTGRADGNIGHLDGESRRAALLHRAAGTTGFSGRRGSR